MTWGSATTLAVGSAVLVWFVQSVGMSAMVADLVLAGGALPAAAAVHLMQLYLSALAWRVSLGGVGASRTTIFRLRWIREGVNALLPVAQIGGQVVGVRMLTRLGINPALATAATVLDVTLEAAAQLLFTLAGMGVLLAAHRDHVWVQWVGGSLLLTALGVAALVAVQRLGLMRLVEDLPTRLATRWLPDARWSMRGLHQMLMARHADRPALLRATALHTLSWALGGAEVWIILTHLGRVVSPSEAVVIESLGMAARSAGFAVPGALGVQEGGFVLVCGLFGIPSEAALTMSVLKRLREALIGIPALVSWRWRLPAPAANEA